MIVPPEYRVAGSLPAAWFIRDLMECLARPYYVGLLTAASLHGAAHQAPQEFQVVTDRPLGVIEIGRVRIRFVKKARLSRTATIGVKTPTGEMRVSTPEATALDLVRYPEHCGGLSNVATILRELAERLDGGELVRVAEVDGEVAYAQRLGYLLDRAGRPEIARALAEWVDARAPRATPLSPGAPITGTERDGRWRVAVNEEVDLEVRANLVGRGRRQMDQVRDRLRRLRDEARALADAPSLSLDSVSDWRRRASAAIEEIYGADSEAARDFAKIKFDEIPLPAADKALRRGLYEAADLLSSLTL
ncbi:MAG: type IV toxin-antitoxin system AbiEi family antitoxin [Candidatus Rokubacteria bacterium]|nr:type IV toxin-antitoxin system AbiEi family antitoxin [Candidatus Rokubacteria bacterium]